MNAKQNGNKVPVKKSKISKVTLNFRSTKPDEDQQVMHY